MAGRETASPAINPENFVIINEELSSLRVLLGLFRLNDYQL